MQGGCGANHTTFSAYRLHADDPLVVQGPEMHSETWRNGNIRSNDILLCSSNNKAAIRTN